MLNRLAVLVVLQMATAAAAQPAPGDLRTRQPRSLKELIVPPTDRKPLERAARADQSAVLSLMLSGDGRSAPRLSTLRLVDSAAPKVFARSGGDWEVRLIGAETVTYRISNPVTDVEVENPPGSRTPFSQVRQTGDVPFDLIVPLSRNGRALGVRRVDIVDLTTGRTVISTPVRGAR